MKENKAYIGIGTNMGDREKNIKIALSEIKNFSDISSKSKIHETNPVGFKDQRKFLNMVIELLTDLSPLDLLLKLQEIENKMGRIRKFKNGPRIIDLDILTYDDIELNLPNLVIPHPRMHERDFVITPLKEILNDFDNR